MKALVSCKLGFYFYRGQKIGQEPVEFELSDGEIETLSAIESLIVAADKPKSKAKPDEDPTLEFPEEKKPSRKKRE